MYTYIYIKGQSKAFKGVPRNNSLSNRNCFFCIQSNRMIYLGEQKGRILKSGRFFPTSIAGFEKHHMGGGGQIELLSVRFPLKKMSNRDLYYMYTTLNYPKRWFTAGVNDFCKKCLRIGSMIYPNDLRETSKFSPSLLVSWQTDFALCIYIT